jgi:HlyD family secretion protein
MQKVRLGAQRRRWSSFGILVAVLLLAACAGPGATPTPEAAATPAVTVIPSATAAASPTAAATAIAEPSTGVAAAAVPAQPVNPETGAFRYTGQIVARAEVNVVAEVAGDVLEVAVEVGDRVSAGDLLVRLDSIRLEAQQAQALAALQGAQAQLELLTTPPDEADINAAQAAVAAAAAAYQQATKGASDEDLRLAEAQLRSAQAAVTAAQAAYNQVKGDQYIASRPETLQLEQAKLQVQAAQARYDQVVKGATPDVIAGAYAQLAQARARLINLQAGPPADQIEAVEAQVRQAEAALYLAQLQVSKATVRAPVDGVVVRVPTAAGATANSGSLLAVLMTGGVEVTIPVEETRLPDLRVGQPATIRVDAYPDRVFAGEVAILAPRVNPATRTIQVTIRPTEEAPDLLPGMFATVELNFD